LRADSQVDGTAICKAVQTASIPVLASGTKKDSLLQSGLSSCQKFRIVETIVAFSIAEYSKTAEIVSRWRHSLPFLRFACMPIFLMALGAFPVGSPLTDALAGAGLDQAFLEVPHRRALRNPGAGAQPDEALKASTRSRS
jgi:hypothetical protein